MVVCFGGWGVGESGGGGGVVGVVGGEGLNQFDSIVNTVVSRGIVGDCTQHTTARWGACVPSTHLSVGVHVYPAHNCPLGCMCTQYTPFTLRVHVYPAQTCPLGCMYRVKCTQHTPAR